MVSLWVCHSIGGSAEDVTGVRRVNFDSYGTEVSLDPHPTRRDEAVGYRNGRPDLRGLNDPECRVTRGYAPRCLSVLR